MAGPVPVLVGPTASGKTAVSLPLAGRLGAEIVSVDSRQVYRGMEIGSAAPVAAERARVPHHLVGIREPEDPLDAGTFGRLARDAIAEIRGRGPEALLVGGSGLYLRAALGGLDEGMPRDPEVRDRLRARVEHEGAPALHAELAAADPETAAAVSPRDGQRITRALELLELTGRPASELRSRGRRTDLPARTVVLDRDRGDLDRRIRERVRGMIADGLAGEVRRLLDRGLDPGGAVLKSVGYAETIAHLRGELDPREWEDAIVLNTRRFAKRQRTWFRGMKDALWIAVASDADPDRVAAEIVAAWESV